METKNLTHFTEKKLAGIQPPNLIFLIAYIFKLVSFRFFFYFVVVVRVLLTFFAFFLVTPLTVSLFTNTRELGKVMGEWTTSRGGSRAVQVISRNHPNVSKSTFVTSRVLYCRSRNQLLPFAFNREA